MAGAQNDQDDRKPSSPQEEFSSAAESVKDDAGRFAEAAKEEFNQRASEANEALSARAESAKSGTVDAMTKFAAAMRKAGDDLRVNDQPGTARLVGEAANGLDRFSRAISEQSINGLVDSIRAFAKSNPAMFLTGSVVAGIALGRFARSSSHHSRPEDASERPTGEAQGWDNDRPSDSSIHGKGETA